MVGVSHSTASSGPQRVAVVIAARDDRETIPATVRACYAIPDVDLIVVVDDGSDDDTAHAARGAGAVVVRHSVPRGRASALETGGAVDAGMLSGTYVWMKSTLDNGSASSSRRGLKPRR